MDRKVVLRDGPNARGANLYKITEYDGKFTAYKYSGSFFEKWDRVGSAKTLRDALELIKAHGEATLVDIE